ncbi:collagen alpha-1(III) chain-like isoform X2 [Erinaceus europaeus]|uniref:Collagen alpha-1(III) chain-like isoform X2 n=1 Tax=Erinaceus europaeus TaxID=9365 RepID=A0ABM3Y8W6_ERIEU|nr:collagen alpha-1(III) chain-like isoform X2 [Erinaceus europaeus]
MPAQRPESRAGDAVRSGRRVAVTAGGRARGSPAHRQQGPGCDRSKAQAPLPPGEANAGGSGESGRTGGAAGREVQSPAGRGAGRPLLPWRPNKGPRKCPAARPRLPGRAALSPGSPPPPTGPTREAGPAGARGGPGAAGSMAGTRRGAGGRAPSEKRGEEGARAGTREAAGGRGARRGRESRGARARGRRRGRGAAGARAGGGSLRRPSPRATFPFPHHRRRRAAARRLPGQRLAAPGRAGRQVGLGLSFSPGGGGVIPTDSPLQAATEASREKEATARSFRTMAKYPMVLMTL